MHFGMIIRCAYLILKFKEFFDGKTIFKVQAKVIDAKKSHLEQTCFTVLLFERSTSSSLYQVNGKLVDVS